jgi:transcriptional regulator with XRE-family HTH domain
MKKSPSDIDKLIGQRVKRQRIKIGMSQERLGELLGITFQQVQKYEKGTNRISVGRLTGIAAALGVNVHWFFDDMGAPARETEALVADKDSLELLRVFSTVENPAMRKAILAIARAAAAPAATTAGPVGKRTLRAV